MLTIISDSEIRSLLHSLSRDEILRLQENLAEALHEYSTGTQESSGCASSNQPKRISIPARNQQATLFMPACTSTSRGMKIVTLAAPQSGGVVASPLSTSTPTTLSPSASYSGGSGGSHSHSSTPTSSHAPSIASLKSADTSVLSLQSTTPRGSLTLLTPSGEPYAFLAAEELTAFRTALAATLLFYRRDKVHNVTVFGSGKQAYWHIRLALILRGPDIHHIDIVNRGFARAQDLLQEIHTSPDWTDLRATNPKLRFSILSADYGEYNRILKDHVRGSDAIFLCTPSLTPLFPAEFLTNPEGRRKGRYISAIGSYRPHMVEMHPDILRQAVAPDHQHHHHKHAEKGGVVVVDSLEACLREAGEVRQAGLAPEQLVEVGELLMVKKASMKEIALGGAGEKGLKKWIEAGNVIYKSVGLGLMDICVGEDLVGLAREKKVGVTMEF